MTRTIDARGPNSGTAALDVGVDVVELLVLSPTLLVVLSDGNPKFAAGSIGVAPKSVELSLVIPGSVKLSDGMPESVELFPARGSSGLAAPGSGVCAYANLNNEESSLKTAKLATVRIKIDNKTADAPIVILLTCFY